MKILCLEGCSGSGKTTQRHLLNDHYTKSSINCLCVVEKEYEPFKSLVKRWYERGGTRVPITKLDVLDFAKSRAETFQRNFSHLEGKIDFLLFDKYFYTSAVYQVESGFNPKEIMQINLQYGCPVPHKTFLFDIDAEVCFNRAHNRNKITGWYHGFSINPEEVEKIRKRYIELSRLCPEVEIIDAGMSPEEIKNYLLKRISEL